ncbi:DegT/DnrJ/EryC1/StrS family aminotransferase [Micromonospora olivasterospora]|uniref:dTDP-4-amino-4,6-dideoxygalactose transaminase n=1 Tax=Micromonospora olivasterospora TaxID=1880 RepID=A0A562I299_MICOL|nr:DegT/DnrJ/EryC1/StrS family aminotransferase [Micromonospora olivasterospora]TWH65120.1 dTDP-4-amino-4,6-dideoxygalactose transaminase [Micromonospora olivasterospora]
MIPLLRPAMSPEVPARVARVIDSGLVGHGPVVEEFERALRARVGNPYLAAVNSGSSALHLALRLVADRPGGDGRRRDEVLATPLTFEASNWAVLANGLRLRWVDVDPASLNVDLDDLERKLSPATRAVVVVHWGGYPVDLRRLATILDRAEAAWGHRPAAVEDCAHAWGSTFEGRPLGNHGNLCVFSFHAIKHLTCGSGGLLVAADDETYRRARLLRWYGIDRSADRVHGDYDVAEWGYNFHLNEIEAAIGLANLDLVDANVRAHRDNAAYYDRELAGVAGVELTERRPDRESSYWLYPLKVRDRPAFMRRMTAAGIMTSVVIRRNDAHSCVRDAATDLPGLDRVHERMVHIPVGWWLSERDREHVVRTIRAGW